ncbi:VOC family protein [Budvicia diplopodorum]|uniref:VOC family protein n=1 Tax=Budvicia diplopodorum TaxID=1119056 RepID=UPI00135A12EF|nr:VOC family protein [Budvicia diplopodorum]
MSQPSLFILYVDNPTASKDFYQELLGLTVVESSPTFVMFSLSSGAMMALWSKHTVEPKVGQITASGEYAISVESDSIVDEYHQRWSSKGITIIQQPQHKECGYTFTATDPDGHRLRVFSMPECMNNPRYCQ